MQHATLTMLAIRMVSPALKGRGAGGGLKIMHNA